ncbi:Pantoate-beta-alanine ligase [Crepidotus variabilis]|uniref:Pantoate--beta-alanine ligase n=1 Tax=Crepidotus variabilis TaxID=179855 RepID=A0A9P6EKP7_9AGAR|nr:Pantoate-beta-alanine ligase [Crepidotus variabilis]
MPSVSNPNLPLSIIRFSTISAYRAWRHEALLDGKTVGFVPTMGALHEGHISLVKRSLVANDLTVVSIFVNPAQFAPHEDLATYPRTLPRDMELLKDLKVDVADQTSGDRVKRRVAAVFAPTVVEMYPSGIVQNIAEQKGAFVEVKGFGHQMEGKSRPTFFRGVTTVVTKLFNVVQPTHAYFGQKDIQQALILKRLCRDLLFGYPEHQNVHIIPTERDSTDELALSSRNQYLTVDGRKVASILIEALKAAAKAWTESRSKAECIEEAYRTVERKEAKAKSDGLQVVIKLDYIEMNDAESFDVLEGEVQRDEEESRVVILSGALYIDKTRLIDNILLGNASHIIG